MLEEKIGELIKVIAANTAALEMAYGTTHKEVSRETSSDVVEEPVKKPAKKKAKKKTKKVEPQTEPTQESEAPVQAAETAPVMDAGKVQTHLRAIASQLKDTSLLFALIQEKGGQQFSDLDASVYPALIEAAEQLVADGK